MPDAIRATIELMEAPAEKISVRTSYNISGLAFLLLKLLLQLKNIFLNLKLTIIPIIGRQLQIAGRKALMMLLHVKTGDGNMNTIWKN